MIVDEIMRWKRHPGAGYNDAERDRDRSSGFTLGIHSFFGSSLFTFVATDIISFLGSGNDNHDFQRISSPIYEK